MTCELNFCRGSPRFHYRRPHARIRTVTMCVIELTKLSFLVKHVFQKVDSLMPQGANNNKLRAGLTADMVSMMHTRSRFVYKDCLMTSLSVALTTSW